MATNEDPNTDDRLTEATKGLIRIILDKIDREAIPEVATRKKLPDKLITAKEVCRYFQISQTTLERRVRAGLTYSQAVKKGNRLFKLSECENFFNIK